MKLEQIDTDRHFGTTSERHILALEMIADKLALISEILSTLLPAATSIRPSDKIDQSDKRLDSEDEEIL